jgi:hypothetical protein
VRRPVSAASRRASVLRDVGATITKAVVLLGVVAVTGIVVAVITGFVFVKRKDPNHEVAQADEPLLETEEFY